MPSLPNTFYAILDGKFVSVDMQFTPVMGLMQFATELAQNQAVHLPMLFSSKETGPISMSLSGGLIYMSCRLRQLPAKNLMIPGTITSTDLVWAPTFNPKPEPKPYSLGFSRMNHDPFPIPEGISVYLIGSFSNSGAKRLFTNAFLVAIIGKEVYTIPYPNVYENGTICMGNDANRISAFSERNTLLDSFRLLFECFMTSNMSTHLTNNRSSMLLSQRMQVTDNPDNLPIWRVTDTTQFKKLCLASAALAVLFPVCYSLANYPHP